MSMGGPYTVTSKMNKFENVEGERARDLYRGGREVGPCIGGRAMTLHRRVGNLSAGIPQLQNITFPQLHMQAVIHIILKNRLKSVFRGWKRGHLLV